MMDWYMVQFLYPIAFKKFTDIMFPNVGVISLSTLELYDMKKLYQFFDRQGIFLTTEMCRKNQWLFTISLQNGVVLGPTQDSKTTRTDIESEGFMECFKIMDKTLREPI
jgi:hypothetical protein